MAYNAKKTEHSGPKKGRGSYYGRKAVAKKESSHVRRQAGRKEAETLTCGHCAHEFDRGDRSNIVGDHADCPFCGWDNP
jgi:predicted RNA-binding Zn-ribbon protein involved in translation (DUF1610 family)